MNTKRLTVILIAVVFALVVLFSCVGLMSVKKVQVNYAVSDERDSETVQKVLNGYLGRNLLFLDTSEVVDSLKDKYNIEVLSVNKRFPNVLSVSIKERREIYYVEYNDVVYVTTENGFVINSFNGHATENRNIIKLNLGNAIDVKELKLGKTLKTDNDAVLKQVFNIAKQVNLTDCIKTISIEKYSDRDTISGYEYDVYFECHTGVKIRLVDLLFDGEKKGIKGFEVYDTLASDYQKRFGEIQVIYVDTDADGVEDTFSIKHTYDAANDKQDTTLFEQKLFA